MSNDNFKIGVASHGKTNFQGRTKFFYIKDNEDNVYRVLPPLFSLAEHGRYAKWYAVHRGLRGTDGRQKAFMCLEETEQKTRLITRHCPLCDLTRDLEAQVKLAKDKGATKDQLQNFRIKMIMPVQSERKYYINVVNQDNQIGVLPISSRMFNGLRALCEEEDKKGRDITGRDGLFLNFKKQTKYKGDKDAVHSVGLFLQSSTDGSYRPVIHQLTTEFVERLKTEAADLNELFKSLTQEEVAALAAAPDVERPKLIDRVFAAPERQTNQLNPGETAIGNTTAVAVTRLEMTSDGLTSKSIGPIPSETRLPETKAAPSAPAPLLTQTTGLSDDEFHKLFMPS